MLPWLSDEEANRSARISRGKLYYKTLTHRFYCRMQFLRELASEAIFEYVVSMPLAFRQRPG